MINEEILKRLKALRQDMTNYAKYLEESTYHPYDKIENFAWDLKHIINEIEKETEV